MNERIVLFFYSIYLLELGYMDNLTDITNMINNQDKYAEAMADAIQEYLNQE